MKTKRLNPKGFSFFVFCVERGETTDARTGVSKGNGGTKEFLPTNKPRGLLVNGSESTFPHVKNKNKSERACSCFYVRKVVRPSMQEREEEGVWTVRKSSCQQAKIVEGSNPPSPM